MWYSLRRRWSSIELGSLGHVSYFEKFMFEVITNTDLHSIKLLQQSKPCSIFFPAFGMLNPFFQPNLHNVDTSDEYVCVHTIAVNRATLAVQTTAPGQILLLR